MAPAATIVRFQAACNRSGSTLNVLHRALALLVGSVQLGACQSATPSPTREMNATAAVAVPPVTPASTPTMGRANGPHPVLVETTLLVVEEAVRVTKAHLALVSAEEALKEGSARAEDRIGGYPTKGAPSTLAPAERQKLIATLSDPHNFAQGVRMRCRHAGLVGVRFDMPPNRVDFTVSENCGLATFTSITDNKVVRSSGVMGPQARSDVLETLSLKK